MFLNKPTCVQNVQNVSYRDVLGPALNNEIRLKAVEFGALRSVNGITRLGDCRERGCSD